SGGTGTYTYTWLPSGGNGATACNLTAGTYTVIINDANGCSVSGTAVITQPPILTASITTITNASCGSCNDGSIAVTANGGTGSYTYSWSTIPPQYTATATGLL